MRGGERGGFNFFARAAAGIDVTLGGETFEGGAIRREIAPLCEGAGVPIDAEPLEHVDRFFTGASLHAGAVEVFDAEDDLPALLPREGPVHEERTGVAQVEGAGG